MFAAENGSINIVELLCTRPDIDLDLMDHDEVLFLFITPQ